MESSNILILLIALFIFQKLNNKYGIVTFIFTKFVNSNNAIHKKAAKLNAEYKTIKLEQDGISAQDQYGKWTKLNRKLDEIEKKKKTLKTELDAINKQNKENVQKYEKFLIKFPFMGLKMWYGKTLLLEFESIKSISKVLPYTLEQMCTVGITGLPLIFIKQAIAFIRNDSSKIAAAKPSTGVSFGILFYCLESVISELFTIFNSNVFSKVEFPHHALKEEFEKHDLD
ncbi:hypothetical protein QEN19_002413 [Hanseniaspora menglaensis]